MNKKLFTLPGKKLLYKAMLMLIIISGLMTAVTKMDVLRVDAATDGVVCPAGQEEIFGTCYGACDAGYVAFGILCSQICPPGYTDSGFTCYIPTHIFAKANIPRGAGTPLTCASNEDLNGALCYPKCQAGYRGDGPVCWEVCKAGYRNDPASCFKSIFDWYFKKSYGRGAGRAVSTCPPGKENNSGLCYPVCRAGYRGEGPLCLQICPAGYKDDGGFCRRDIVSFDKTTKSRVTGVIGTCPSPGFDRNINSPPQTGSFSLIYMNQPLAGHPSPNDLRFLKKKVDAANELLANTVNNVIGTVIIGSPMATHIRPLPSAQFGNIFGVKPSATPISGVLNMPIWIGLDQSNMPNLEETVDTNEIRWEQARWMKGVIGCNSLPNFAGNLKSYDAGSMAYSWEIGNYHFVQLHAHPSYAMQGTGINTGFNITPAKNWLIKDMNAATLAGKHIVIHYANYYANQDIYLKAFFDDTPELKSALPNLKLLLNNLNANDVVETITVGNLSGSYKAIPLGSDQKIKQVMFSPNGVYVYALDYVNYIPLTTTSYVRIYETSFNQRPQISSQTFAVTQNTPLTFTIAASDPDNNIGEFRILQRPVAGKLQSLSTLGEFQYTPNQGVVGLDAFTVIAVDRENLLSEVAQIRLDITAANTPPNSAPVATDQTLSMLAGESLTITVKCDDQDNDPLTYALMRRAAHGELKWVGPNLLSYTPLPGFEGEDSFVYQADDKRRLSNPSTVTITVKNRTPAAADLQVTGDEDTPIKISLLASDFEHDPLQYTYLTTPTNGVLSGDGDNLLYTPAPHFYGNDSFVYRVNDAKGASRSATVSITVRAANDAPIANNLTLNGDNDAPIAIALNAHDLDYEGLDDAGLSYEVISQPSQGKLEGNAPDLQFIPNPNFVGVTSFNYRASDGKAQSNVATVTLNISQATPKGTLAGLLYHDINGNGKQDPDEGGIGNAVITLVPKAADLDLMQRNDTATDYSVATDLSGVYQLTGVAVGQYTLRLAAAPGQTLAALPTTDITIRQSAITQAAPFGVQVTRWSLWLPVGLK